MSMRFPVDIKSITLDLDGTLLDTVPDIHIAVNATLNDFSLPELSQLAVRNLVGGGIPRLVERILPQELAQRPATLAQALAAFERHYAISNGRHAAVYPGVMEGLRALSAARLPLACITNKNMAFVTPLLAMTGLAPYLQLVLGGDSLPEKKPHPLPLLEACRRFGTMPAENLHIGDSKHDAAAARAAGCVSFSVPYGYNEGEDVQSIDNDAIVPTIAAALELIRAAN